jgi:hypothetical protein
MDSSKQAQRAVIQFLSTEGVSVTDNHSRMNIVFGTECIHSVTRWACLEESMARSLTVISLLFQSETHCRYRVYTKNFSWHTLPSTGEIAKSYRWELRRSNLSPTFTWARLIQMVFLMMNTRCSKHVEGTNNCFKTLMWKVCSLFVYIIHFLSHR